VEGHGFKSPQLNPVGAVDGVQALPHPARLALQKSSYQPGPLHISRSRSHDSAAEVRLVLRFDVRPHLNIVLQGPMSAVKNKYRGTTTYVHVLAELVRAAQYRGLTTYQDIALIMGLPLKGSHMGAQAGHILGEISEDEVRAGRPMLSAVAVGVGGKPGPGFYELARTLQRPGADSDDPTFWERELTAVYNAWKRPLSD